MIKFYKQGSGSSEIILLDPIFPEAEWARLKAVVVRFLGQKGQTRAAGLLRDNPFTLHHGENSFGDSFNLLYMKMPGAKYIELSELINDWSAEYDFQDLALAIGEVGHPVRFIAMELDTADGPDPVVSPVLAITSELVERALSDAERLIATQGAASSVDRVHTAFHGYLRGVVSGARITSQDNATLPDLFKLLREQHPAFRSDRSNQNHIDRMMRSLSAVVDALSPLRNHSSLSHPNATLLEEPEAMLVVNFIRTMLHYIDSKISK